MGISQETIDEVRQYPDVLRVFQTYISLKKRGKHFLGLCPFHSEKTPSFNVNIEKKMFYCFGCQASGDHIAFVQQIENLNFPEAIEEIASILGLVVKKNNQENPGKKKDHYFKIEALSKAQVLFKKALYDSVAYAYLKQRGVSDEMMACFGLGYANKGVIKQLIEEGVSKHVLLESGLALSREGDCFGRFTKRLVFPISNHIGKILGFGGRILEQDQGAKYLNSPESEVFQKSQLLYGLDLAKKHIKKAERCIVVEGYLDVIGLHQRGFKETVAVMGTALGLKQGHLLKRFTDKIVLFFDHDLAGQEAIKKSYMVLKPLGFDIEVIELSDGDPADLCFSNQQDSLSVTLDATKPFLEWLCQAHNGLKEASIEQKSKLIQQLKPFFTLEKDPLILEHYKRFLSEVLNVSKNLIRFDGGDMVYNRNNAPKTLEDKYIKAEKLLVASAVSSITLRSKLKQCNESFQLENTIYKQIYHKLKDSEKENLDAIHDLDSVELKRVACDLLNREFLKRKGKISDEEFTDCIYVLKERQTKVRLQELKELLLKNDASEKQQSDWLSELQTLLLNERGLNVKRTNL